LEFNVPFQHKYGYIRDETRLEIIWGNKRGVFTEHTVQPRLQMHT